MRSIAIRLAAILFVVPFAFGQTQINIDTQTKGSRLPFWSVDSGTANTYSITPVASVTVLQTGSCFLWKAANANTGASTLTVSGFSSHSITKNGTTALAAGDIAANRIVTTCYDGTQYQLLAPGISAGTGSINNTCSDGLNGTCIFRPNDGTTGTVLGVPTKYRASSTNDSAVIKMTSADNSLGWFNSFLGICIANCGTSGLAEIKIEGTVACLFESGNTPTKGDLVDIGSNGKCFDNSSAGVNEDPDIHTFVGVTRVTGSSGSTQQIDLNKLQSYGGMWGAYNFSHGAPAYGMFQTWGSLPSVGPEELENQNPGGTAFPATSIIPAIGLLGGMRWHSLSSNGEIFDIYGIENHGGGVNSDVVLDGSSDEGFSGGSLRIACDSNTACASLNHAWSHFSPPYIANLTGTVSQIDTQADRYDFTLTGNTTLTVIYINPGHISFYHVCEDSTGGWTLAFGTPLFLVYGSSSAPSGTMVNVNGLKSTAANACTDFVFQGVQSPAYQFDCIAGSGCAGSSSGTVTSITAGTGLTGGTITGSGTIALSTPVSVANGGTGDSTLTAHGVLIGNGTGGVSVTSAGTATNCLVSNGASADPTFQSCTTGGTGISGATSNGAMYASGSTTGTSTGALTNGQILIGDTGNAPQAATITAGSNITVTNGAHSITIASTGGSSGPTYGYLQCTLYEPSGTNHTSQNCASTVNEVVGDYMMATCQVYTAGTSPTLAMSNTHGDTWTQVNIHTDSGSGFRSAIFTATAGSSGADTFTCTIGTTNAFWAIGVNKLTNVTGTDITTSTNDSTGTTHVSASFTTSHANELAFYLENDGGGGNMKAYFVGWPAISNYGFVYTGPVAAVLGVTSLPIAGTYTLGVGGTNNAGYSAMVVTFY